VKLLLDFDIEPVLPSAGTIRKEVKGFAIYDDHHLYFQEKREVSRG